MPGAVLPASAQDEDRYTLERTDDGYVRMDRRTGTMSLCNERDGQLVCRLAADDRDALESEIDRLSGALSALTERVDALEGKAAEHNGGAAGLPSESEFEQGLSYMERFFRRFMGIVQEFDRSRRDETPGPDPQKT
ncbi:MAG: hypothetical protein JNL61_20810 [Rhizobiaceae bacterium]|nr:hypothetical protein [Rhizobiaceae bacterium]